jgi:hypothetical protein
MSFEKLAVTGSRIWITLTAVLDLFLFIGQPVVS